MTNPNDPASPMDYRSWGESRNCHGCRYWSEMLARSHGSGTQAMCIAPRNADAPHSGKYTDKRQTCNAWADGCFGAVDSPGGNPYEDAP